MAEPIARPLSPSAFLKSRCTRLLYTKQTKKTKNPVLRPQPKTATILLAHPRRWSHNFALTSTTRRCLPSVSANEPRAENGIVNLGAGMDCQLSVWQGQGEWFGAFTRLTSAISVGQFPGGEVQLLSERPT